MNGKPEPRGALLHRLEPELVATLPHMPLSQRPTPVRKLIGLARRSGGPAPVWIKDDGAYGSGGWGGNKVRKLEWILPEAKRRGSKTILTVGGLGTNWGLAVALYARDHGLKTALALVDQPKDEHVRAQLERLRRAGAQLHFTHTKGRTIALAPLLIARHFDGLTPPYFLPAGGSNAIGALGYVEAALEIADQVSRGELPEPSHVVVPVGSGGTAAGLALGLRMAGLRSQVVGVVVNDTLRLDEATLEKLAWRSAGLLRTRGARMRVGGASAGLRIEAPREWIGPGYGHPTVESEAARVLLEESDGVHLDPVYTAKAMAGLIAMNAGGHFGEGPVLYVHTDGPR
jgi:D-cysteine desulfhydrase